MKKLICMIICLGILGVFTGCSAKSKYNEEMYKNAVKNRSENSADRGFKDLDRETK